MTYAALWPMSDVGGGVDLPSILGGLDAPVNKQSKQKRNNNLSNLTYLLSTYRENNWNTVVPHSTANSNVVSKVLNPPPARAIVTVQVD